MSEIPLGASPVPVTLKGLTCAWAVCDARVRVTASAADSCRWPVAAAGPQDASPFSPRPALGRYRRHLAERRAAAAAGFADGSPGLAALFLQPGCRAGPPGAARSCPLLLWSLQPGH